MFYTYPKPHSLSKKSKYLYTHPKPGSLNKKSSLAKNRIQGFREFIFKNLKIFLRLFILQHFTLFFSILN